MLDLKRGAIFAFLQVPHLYNLTTILGIMMNGTFCEKYHCYVTNPKKVTIFVSFPLTLSNSSSE